MMNEHLVGGELYRKANGSSLADLLEDADFRSVLSELPDQSAGGVAKTIVAFHVASKMERLTELMDGGPLDVPHPTTDFTVDRVAVTLLGVRHGLFSGWEIQPEYKKAVLRVIKHRPGMWFIEQGVSEQFGIVRTDNVVEMSDAQMFFDSIKTKRTGNRWKDVVAVFKDNLKAGTTSPTMFNFVDKSILSMFRKINSLTLKDIMDPRYTYNAIAFLRELELPEPMDMEVRYILGNAACGPDVCIDRSRIQAELIRENGMSLAGVCGAVTGADHTSQIKFFLENPAYDPKEAVKKIFQVLG